MTRDHAAALRVVCPACGGQRTQPPALPDGIWPRCSWCGNLPGAVGPKSAEEAALAAVADKLTGGE